MAIKLNEYDFGKVLDFFQGRQDLAKGKVRVLHTLSFIEDPTRIFRAVRFAHRFQYKLAKQTLELDGSLFVRATPHGDGVVNGPDV